MSLADNKCVPCRGGVPPLPADRAQALLKELGRGWSLNAQGHLERLYTFKDFAQALAYVNRVCAIAEAEGHHPELYLAWGKCKVESWTHKINGLTWPSPPATSGRGTIKQRGIVAREDAIAGPLYARFIADLKARRIDILEEVKPA